MNQDRKSAQLLIPLLRGEDVKRWHVEPEGLFLINTPRGKIDIEKYPAIRDWLLPFKADLEERATVQEWWELQQAQLAYQPKFAGPKVIWPQFLDRPEFCVEKEGIFPINKCYLFSTDDEALVALLNSRAVWFCFVSTSVVKRGGFREATAQHIGPLPWPDLSKGRRTQLVNLSQSCRKAAGQSLAIRIDFHHRILSDLAPPERQKLTGKLENFWMLDFAAFRAELKKAFKAEIAVKDRDGWEKYLAEKSAEVIKLRADIEAAECATDAIVYKLFDLTPDEIKLLENSLDGQ